MRSCRLLKPAPAGVQQEGAHKEAVRGISFAPTDLKFVTGSDDSTVKVGSQHLPGTPLPPAASALCSERACASAHTTASKSSWWGQPSRLLLSQHRTLTGILHMARISS